MKLLRLFSLLLPTIAVNLVLPSAFAAEIGPLGPQGTSIPFYDRAAQTQRMWLLDGYDRFESYSPDTRMTIVKTPTDGGIREDVPAKFKEVKMETVVEALEASSKDGREPILFSDCLGNV